MIRRILAALAAVACIAGGVAAGTRSADAADSRTAKLEITTRALAHGVKGLYFLQVLTASGGVTPYTWKASGLPKGLTISKAGVISGYPRSGRTVNVALTVRDARRATSKRKLRFRIPASLPARCVARSCAELSPDRHTLQIAARAVTSVTRSATSGLVTEVGLTGVKVAKGDIVVLAPGADIPSGLIAVVNSVSTTGTGTSTVRVTRANPGEAYHDGTVQAIGKAVGGTDLIVGQNRSAAGWPKRPGDVHGQPEADLECDGDATAELNGLTVTPSLTPALTAIWKHPLFGGKGIYLGLGGLSLFQFDLTGTIKVNLGVAVSGQATCTMDLPGIDRLVPAGDLGAVLLQLDPTLTLETTGAVDVETSVTLTCGAEYRWDNGTSYRTDYCAETHQPLALTSSSGVDATLTGAIDASVSLDDTVGIKGSIDAALHAGYHPTQTPVADIDAKSEYDLKATLANFWKGAPTLSLVHGTIFDKVLATYGSPPPGAGPSGPPAITVSPDLAYPWSDAVCGFDDPTFGSTTFTVDGTGFQPGESVAVSTDWSAYNGDNQVSDADGNFSVTEPVGEVPSVSDDIYGVYASGNLGSSASGEIELNSDGCIFQSDDGGSVSLQWGGNGFDPSSTVSLLINGDEISSATTDDLGSGGTTAQFDCPDSGSYTWEVLGTVDGQPEDATDSFDCAPASDPSSTGRVRGAAAASPTSG
jgi:hypothetical protein